MLAHRYVSNFIVVKWAGLFLTVMATVSSFFCYAETPTHFVAAEPWCLDELMSKLNIDISAHTVPALLNDILHNDMYLDDMPSFVQALGAKLNTPQPLAPMITAIRNNIAEKQPTMTQFICNALARNLIPVADDKTKVIVTRTINHAFLLENLVQKMIESPAFMDEVQIHLMKKRNELGVAYGADILKVTNSVFDAAKTISIDRSMRRFSASRQNGYINPVDYAALQYGLPFNILEATTADSFHGYYNNAKTGLILTQNPLPVLAVSGNNRVIDFVNHTQQWTSLYETWNFAFIIGNLKHPNILFPKLLIPSVVGAEPKAYIFNRVLALWASINFYLFAEIKQSGEEIQIAQSVELAKLWGEINLEIANKRLLN